MRLLICLLTLGTLAACGANVPAAAPPVAASTAAAAASTTSAVAPVAVTVEAQALALVELLRPQLATQLGVDPTSLSLISAQATRWRNSALGCPAPDAMYTQVIIDGYTLIFSDGSRTYELHAGGPSGPALLCDNGTPKPLGA